MSKKQGFERIAKQVGIIRPHVTYKPRMGYVIDIADVPMSDRAGYTSLEVGLYQSIDEAKMQLADDIRACINRNLADYPDILERVIEKYHPVTDDLSERDITHQLLQALANDPAKAKQATIALEYIQSLESKIDADTVHPKGTYDSKYPDIQKKPIDWQQPDYREHPVYTFEVDCPYCGQHVTLERHSPREPQHCGKDECATEHNRALARERKRRQRRRQKRNKG